MLSSLLFSYIISSSTLIFLSLFVVFSYLSYSPIVFPLVSLTTTLIQFFLSFLILSPLVASYLVSSFLFSLSNFGYAVYLGIVA